jgi:hypothetical protein
MRPLRTHPLFPTHEEIAENPELLYSDHLPVFFNIPFAAENNATSGEPSIQRNAASTNLRMISWNVLGHNAPSGFHLSSKGWEPKDLGRKRFERIIGSLKLFAEKQNPDIIVLQEANPEFLGSLITELPEWTIRNNNTGPVMLFRSRDQGGKLEIKEYEFKKAGVRHENVYMQACQSALFEMGGHFVKVNNVHTMFYNTPEHHESYYQHLLTKEPSHITTLIVGDTNSRIAPKNDVTPHNIATGVVPMCINKMVNAPEDRQMTDFPDGAFMKKRMTGEIEQLDRQILDYRTGEIFVPENAQNDLPPQWRQFRMLACLDNYKGDRDKIEGKNIFEFEAHLTHYFPNCNVLVRKAAKDNNERGFGFRFSKTSSVYNLIRKALNEKVENEPSDFQCIHYDDQNGRPTPIIFVSTAKMSQLLEIINPVIQALRSIDDRIKAIEKSARNPFLRSGSNKMACLSRLRASILENIGDTPLTTIVSNWEKQDFLVNGENKSAAEIMSEKRNKFVGTFFYRKPPPASETEDCISNLKKIKTSVDELSQQPEQEGNNNNIGM